MISGIFEIVGMISVAIVLSLLFIKVYLKLLDKLTKCIDKKYGDKIRNWFNGS